MGLSVIQAIRDYDDLLGNYIPYCLSAMMASNFPQASSIH